LAHRDCAVGNSASILNLGILGWLRSRPFQKRAITAILYLNDSNWDFKVRQNYRFPPYRHEDCTRILDDLQVDGGELLLFVGTDDDDDTGITATEIITINPSGGTLVVFDSRLILHQVSSVLFFSRKSPKSILFYLFLFYNLWFINHFISGCEDSSTSLRSHCVVQWQSEHVRALRMLN
jgi:hypothetical protein